VLIVCSSIGNRARGFPDQTFNGGNYWVDVVFTPGP